MCRPYAEKYADDQDLFFKDYAEAHIKLSELGEILFHCVRMDYVRLCTSLFLSAYFPSACVPTQSTAHLSPVLHRQASQTKTRYSVWTVQQRIMAACRCGVGHGAIHNLLSQQIRDLIL